jgi:hypothetical protein
MQIQDSVGKVLKQLRPEEIACTAWPMTAMAIFEMFSEKCGYKDQEVLGSALQEGPKKWNIFPIDSPWISWKKSQILLSKSRNPPVRSFEHRAPPDVGTPPLPAPVFAIPPPHIPSRGTPSGWPHRQWNG